MKKKVSPKHLWFMPWANVSNQIKLGPVTIWPYSGQRARRINNPEIRAFLRRYLRKYVDNSGAPVRTIAICSHDQYDFSNDLSKKRLIQINQDIRRAVDALILTTIGNGTVQGIIHKNWSGPPNSDRYQIYQQKFFPDSDDISVRVGSCLLGGWDMKRLKFPQPLCLGGLLDSPDRYLLAGFKSVFRSTKLPDEIENRLWRSLEWFRLSHFDSDDISNETRVTMMSTAFESLISVPQDVDDKQHAIAQWLVENICYEDSIAIKRKNSNNEYSNIIEVAHWFLEFYNRRNQIIHGRINPDSLSYKRKGHDKRHHLLVADVVYFNAVLALLLNYDCISTHSLKGLGSKQDRCKFLKRLHNIRNVHQSLGWIESKQN